MYSIVSPDQANSLEIRQLDEWLADLSVRSGLSGSYSFGYMNKTKLENHVTNHIFAAQAEHVCNNYLRQLVEKHPFATS